MIAHSVVVALLVFGPMVFPDSLPAKVLQGSPMFVLPEPPAGPRVTPLVPTGQKSGHKKPTIENPEMIAPRVIPTEIVKVFDGGGDDSNKTSGLPGGNPGGCISCIGNSNSNGPGNFFPPTIFVAATPPPPPPPPPVPPPQPPPTQIQRIGGDVAQANLINQVKPQYPALAKAAHVQDYVMLQATISKSGTIEDLKILHGHLLLNEAAIQAVKQWRYKPQMLNGEPIEVLTTITVNFSFGQ